MMFSQALLDGQYWTPDEVRKCTFVFIGRDLGKDALVEGFLKCKVTEELRFKVGDPVEAQCEEGWMKGAVVKTWDQGNPYCIELADKMRTKIWGPVDTDEFVR